MKPYGLDRRTGKGRRPFFWPFECNHTGWPSRVSKTSSGKRQSGRRYFAKCARIDGRRECQDAREG